MTPDLAAPLGEDDHVLGTSGGRQLVVYGDFEFPYTAAAMRTVGGLLASGAAFELAFRHFPLRDIHPHAHAASLAAEAAARQGQFWEMHDMLFRGQGQLEAADLIRKAGRLGLDIDRFTADRVDPAVAARVERDVMSGEASGVDGTPSLFIDGMRFRGPRDAESLAGALS
jgi:NhaA family Na+:H+ antiporter